MKTIRIETSSGDLSPSYNVQIQRGIVHRLGEAVRTELSPSRVAILTDSTVDELHGDAVRESLSAAGYHPVTFAFPAGEANKTFVTVGSILEFLADERLTRSDLIVALGGGVPGDIAGFAASIYLRGIRFIQVPTTILAAVDSSVGGKTGADLPQGKNLVGAFWQPSAVFCDPDLFSTLPTERIAEGYAEIIKHGFIADESYLRRLEAIRSWDEDLEATIERSVQIKAAFVAADTRDRGERQKLNFGHTFGHAIEKASNFTLSHGEAVAIGMIMSSRAADRSRLTESSVTDRLIQLCKKFNLPTETNETAEVLADAALSDKKRSGDTIQFVFPVRAGETRLVPIHLPDVPKIFQLALQ